MAAQNPTRRKVSKFGLVFGISLGAVFAGFPAFWMLINSFKPNGEIFEFPPRIVSPNVTLIAYRTIFENSEKVRYFINSYLVAASVSLLTLFVTILAAYAFSRYSFIGKRLFNLVIITFQSIPPITLMIPYFTLVVSLKLFNTYQGLILSHMVFTLPYAIIMLTGYFNTVPRELDEAVKIDGGGAMSILWRILVPISIPGIVSVGIYTFMISWNEFLFALTLTKTQEMRTVPIGIQLLMGQHSYEWNEMMAMSILGSLPILISFLFFQRFFLSGLTTGAVKA
jgi:multiple sugar transport system permease protein